MTAMSRRNLMGGTAAVGSLLATAVSTSRAFAAGEQPPAGPIPAPLSGKELPSFRYPLGGQTAHAYDGGWAALAVLPMEEPPGLWRP